MSLLLDALKKAAAQKAQRSKSEAPAERTSDETLLESGADRAAPAGTTGHSDETELDHSEINARLERGSVVRGGGDDTGLELTQTTDARIEQNQPPTANIDDTGLEISQGDEHTLVNLTAQLEISDAEPIVLESSDATDFVVEHDAINADRAVTEDETDLGQLDARENLTGIGDRQVQEEVESKLGDDDETDLNPLDGEGDLTGIGKPPAEGVEDAADDDDEDTDLRESAGDEDETRPGDADPTDFRQPAPVAEQVEPAGEQLQDSAERASGKGVFDEDLSLLLLEPDPTTPGAAADTAFTEPQAPAKPGRAFAAGAGNVEELALVDTTQTLTGVERTDTQGPTLTNPSETALYADQTSTRQSVEPRARAAQGDPASTRTYAPDNYDRTLMKLPSNDASKLFAGMKSDADVVMTPDYAKQVFRSKTSAQRAQHYKLYGATAFAIMAAIGIFGMFQYQDASFEIDTSLRPLKRDPMPGVIKTPKPEETNLFAGNDSETTARTIEIIETAETAESVEAGEPGSAGLGAVAITAPAATTSPTTTGVVESAPAAGRQAAVPQSQVAQGDNLDPTTAPGEPQTRPVSRSVEATPVEATPVASLSSPEPLQAPAKQPAGTTGNLQIESSNQYLQSDVWLREAYAAYSAGDDQQALRLYNKVVKADPGNRNALLARAAINIQNGDIDAAIRDYQELLLQNPKDSLAMASLLAVTSFSPLETESQLKLMLYDEPDSPFLNFALANAYGAQERWHEAQQYYFKALQANPQDPNYAYNLAVSLEHISQTASAVTYYRRALDNFDSGLATFNREIVIQRLQRLENL